MFSGLLLAEILTGLVCAFIAKTKGRNAVTWFIGGVAFSVFGIIALLNLKDLNELGKVKLDKETLSKIKNNEFVQELMKKDFFSKIIDGIKNEFELLREKIKL